MLSVCAPNLPHIRVATHGKEKLFQRSKHMRLKKEGKSKSSLQRVLKT